MSTAEQALSPIEQNALTTANQARAVLVKTEADYSIACDMVRGIASLAKEVESFFGPMKKKAHEAWKEIVAKEKSVLDPLEAGKKHLSGQIGSYQAQKERERRAEEERLRQIAQREAEERALAEAAALQAQGETKQAEQVLEVAVSAPPPVVVVPKMTPKAEGIATRKNWKFRIVDATKVPREFLTVDEQKVRQYVNAMKESATIPGIEVYSEDSVAVRSF